jgi:hypothetical protein
MKDLCRVANVINVLIGSECCYTKTRTFRGLKVVLKSEKYTSFIEKVFTSTAFVKN